MHRNGLESDGSCVAPTGSSTLVDSNAPAPQLTPPNHNPFPRIPGYQIRGLVGMGGMGTVYKALQLSTHREVALKVLQSDVTRSARLRELFTREVRLAARLQHRNVVSIYDSGVDCGMYYYAMELVDGETLDRYVLGPAPHRTSGVAVQWEQRRLTLELMQRVCQGVQHAHLRGVIHRDIKPRNIVVTPDGEPHVLDFGLATVSLKGQVDEPAADPDAKPRGGGETHSPGGLTEPGSLDWAGTPAFMSPEQARGGARDLDVRTDVYSLGVTLYYLLTGRMPSDVSGGATAVLRNVAQNAILAPREAAENIDRDLEALLLKALAHDREDRYESAGAMAQDIRRYLSSEPLLARAHSTRYVLSKWASRHRRSVTAAACAILIVAALGAHSYSARRALQSTLIDRANYDQTLDGLIARLSPQVSGRQIGYRDLLNESMNDAIRIFHDRPGKLAGVLDRIGMTLFDQGWPRDAETSISRARDLLLNDGRGPAGADPTVELARITNDLAEAKRELGKFAEGVSLSRQALTLAAGLPQGGLRDSQVLRAHIELAYLLDDQGQTDQARLEASAALAFSRESHRDAPRHPEVLRALNTLAFVLRDNGEIDEALERAREALEARTQTLGAAHPDTIRSMDVYASALCLKGDAASLRESLEWIDKAVRLSAATLGEDHCDRLTFENDRGAILCRLGRLPEAVASLRAALDSSRRLLGDEDRSTLAIMSNLQETLRMWADTPGELSPLERDKCREEAGGLLTSIVRLRAASAGPDDPGVLVFTDALAAVQCARGEMKDAQALYERTLAARQRTQGKAAAATSMLNLARVLGYQEKWSEAEPLCRQAWQILAESQGRQSPPAQSALKDLNFDRQVQHKPPEASSP